jgi:general secretion pathway protein G
MMVVVTVIVVLISMAIPMYNRAMIRSKESVLASNLFTLRTVIQHYSYDKARAPHSLQDLVSEGYLRAVPVDPMTNSTDWKTEMEDSTQSVDQSEPGIGAIHSGSDKTGLDGRHYSEW